MQAGAKRTDRGVSGWKTISGLGVSLLPTTVPSPDPATLVTEAPQLDYLIDLPSAGEFTLTLHLLPTHPIASGRGLHLGVGLNDGAPEVLTYAGKDGSAEWAQGVLNNYVTASTTLRVSSAVPDGDRDHRNADGVTPPIDRVLMTGRVLCDPLVHRLVSESHRAPPL